MTPMPLCTSIADTLASMTSGGIEWSARIVTMTFNHREDAWVTFYPIIGTDSPYFDFAYPNEASPQETLAGILERYKHCEVIDWSPGRLACIQAKGASVAQLADLVAEVATEVFGVSQTSVVASYEDIQRA